MMTRTLFLLLAAALSGCAPELPGVPDPGPCCLDDGDPCTEQACVDGACVTTWATPGAACDGVAGFCDSDGVCRESCPAEPCFDSSVVHGYGCVYTVRPNGWTCTDGELHGVCRDAVCVKLTTGGAS